MRRALSAAPRKTRQIRLLFVLAVLLLLVFRAAAALDSHIQPLLEEYAEYETRAMTVQALNAAISQELTAHPERYDALYQMETEPSGSSTVSSNPVALNQAKNYLIQAASAALDDLPEQRVQIPLGSLLNSALLNNLGPSWALTIRPRGYLEGDIRATVQPVAINRVEYRVDLTLSVSLNMILDGSTHILTVTTTVPVVHLLMDGETPRYYYQSIIQKSAAGQGGHRAADGVLALFGPHGTAVEEL